MQQPESGEEVVSGIFEDYSETQREIFAIETRNTRNKLFALAIVVFGFDFLELFLPDQRLNNFIWIIFGCSSQ